MPRRARLARRADLDACWTAGQRARGGHLELAWRPNPIGHARVAVIVPRFHRSAVARNRLRRRLREIVRRGPLAQLPAVDLIVRARGTAYGVPFAILASDLRATLARVR